MIPPPSPAGGAVVGYAVNAGRITLSGLSTRTVFLNIAHCIDFARQIIDGQAKGMSVSDM